MQEKLEKFFFSLFNTWTRSKKKWWSAIAMTNAPTTRSLKSPNFWLLEIQERSTSCLVFFCQTVLRRCQSASAVLVFLKIVAMPMSFQLMCSASIWCQLKKLSLGCMYVLFSGFLSSEKEKSKSYKLCRTEGLMTKTSVFPINILEVQSSIWKSNFILEIVKPLSLYCFLICTHKIDLLQFK